MEPMLHKNVARLPLFYTNPEAKKSDVTTKLITILPHHLINIVFRRMVREISEPST